MLFFNLFTVIVVFLNINNVIVTMCWRQLSLSVCHSYGVLHNFLLLIYIFVCMFCMQIYH